MIFLGVAKLIYRVTGCFDDNLIMANSLIMENN